MEHPTIVVMAESGRKAPGERAKWTGEYMNADALHAGLGFKRFLAAIMAPFR